MESTEPFAEAYMLPQGSGDKSCLSEPIQASLSLALGINRAGGGGGGDGDGEGGGWCVCGMR